MTSPSSPLPRLAELAGQSGLDGWLLYDFRGANPHARTLLGLAGTHLSRRWFLLVPSSGAPILIHHRIEGGNWRSLTEGWNLRYLEYSSHQELDARLREALTGTTRVAMEYSPRGAVPYVSSVDAGTLERVRESGVQVESSADLLQHFLTWSANDRREHERAVLGVVRAKDLAFQFLHDSLKNGDRPSELEAQAVILRAFTDAGLVFDHAPDVAFGSHGSDPHFTPSPAVDRHLEPGTPVLIDLWAGVPGYPMADITWVGFAGEPSGAYLRAWSAVRDARDEAIRLLRAGTAREGWEVDRAARKIIEARGYGQSFTHRLGHSLGRDAPHGAAVNLDDLETHDTRALLPGIGVTVEPGVYLGEFGIRSEVNVILEEGGATVTTPVQEGPLVLGGDYLHEHIAG